MNIKHCTTEAIIDAEQNQVWGTLDPIEYGEVLTICDKHQPKKHCSPQHCDDDPTCGVDDHHNHHECGPDCCTPEWLCETHYAAAWECMVETV